MWGYHHDIGAWAWWLMTAGMVLFWAAVVWLVIALTRTTSARRNNAEDILAERLARGEITEDEFRQRRDLIRR
jgi:putative membrane protein